jgi:ParB/RepB/Spo0J family partition protein
MFKNIPISLLDDWEGRSTSDIEDITDSFSRFGQLSPIMVREEPTNNGHFQVIFGNRRVLAAKRLGWDTITARVVQASDTDALALFLCENLNRTDLCDYDKAVLIEKLHSIGGKTYDEIAKIIGKSPAFVSQHVAMLNMFSDHVGSPTARKRMLVALTERHSRALLKIEDMVERWNIAKLVVSGELGFRETQRICNNASKKRTRMTSNDQDEDVRSVILSFVSGFSSKDITPFFNAVSSHHFTMFPRFPPLTRLDYHSAKEYFCEVLAQMENFEQNILDMQIRVARGFAYATLVIKYKMVIARRTIVSRGRATIILERENLEWRIVHAHWSSGDENATDILTLLANQSRRRFLPHEVSLVNSA